MAYKGSYHPLHPEKYIGDPNKIKYLSLWERSMMKYFDTATSVLKWIAPTGTKGIKVPYLSPKDNTIHSYIPDFVIQAKDKIGNIKILMIEIKPKRQTLPPKIPKRKTKGYFNECVTYAVNIAKWTAAEQFCADKHWEFKIMTEQHIYGKH
jgi:hypothetical protein